MKLWVSLSIGGVVLLLLVGLYFYGSSRYETQLAQARANESKKVSAQTTATEVKMDAPKAPEAPLDITRPTPPESTAASTTDTLPNDTALPKGATLGETKVVPDLPPTSNVPVLNTTPPPRETTQSSGSVLEVPVSQEIATMRPSTASANQEFNPERLAPGRYLYRNTSPEAMQPPAFIGGPPSETENINLESFIPEAETFLVSIKDTIYSSETEIPVKAGVLKAVKFQGHIIFEPFMEVLGTAAAGKKKDRLRVQWTKIKYFDGRTLPIQGFATHIDGTLGVKGYKVGDYFKMLAGPLLAELGSGVLEAISKDNSSSTTIGDTTITSVNNSSSNLLQRSASSGGSKAFARLRDLLLEEVDENAPYVVVPPGTLCKVYLTRWADASLADYGR